MAHTITAHFLPNPRISFTYKCYTEQMKLGFIFNATSVAIEEAF